MKKILLTFCTLTALANLANANFNKSATLTVYKANFQDIKGISAEMQLSEKGLKIVNFIKQHERATDEISKTRLIKDGYIDIQKDTVLNDGTPYKIIFKAIVEKNPNSGQQSINYQFQEVHSNTSNKTRSHINSMESKNILIFDNIKNGTAVLLDLN